MRDNAARLTALYVRAREIADTASAERRELNTAENAELDRIFGEFDRLDNEHWAGREDVRARIADALGLRLQ
jgi:hypothetical protein